MWLPTSALLACLSAVARSESPPLSAPADFASTPTVRLPLLHRVYGQPTWHTRGYLELNPGTNVAKLVPMVDGWAQLDWSSAVVPDLPEYQLGIGANRTTEGEWERVTSFVVPQCLLAHQSSEVWEERFTVYLGDDINSPSFQGLNYQTNSKACNIKQDALEGVVYGGNSVASVSFGHAYEPEPVRFEAAKVEAPVKVGTDGKIVQPEPEKTFLQKYWLYLVAGALVLVMSGGGGPEEGAK